MFGCHADKIFKSGDTLPVGQGGLLVPMKKHPPENVCLELGLTWPNGRRKKFLGEILGVIEEGGLWVCVKLHRVSAALHEKFLSAAQTSKWFSAAA